MTCRQVSWREGKGKPWEEWDGTIFFRKSYRSPRFFRSRASHALAMSNSTCAPQQHYAAKLGAVIQRGARLHVGEERWHFYWDLGGGVGGHDAAWSTPHLSARLSQGVGHGIALLIL